MTITDLILNLGERYITAKDPEDKQRQEDLLRKDFGFYSESKLEKVWYAIKRYHKANFMPNYSAIIDCMDKAGLGESVEHNHNWYQKCTKCGTKYTIGVSCCPKCNKYLETGDMFMNEVDIVKCDDLPRDVIFTRQACPICPIYRASTMYPRGIKCNDYQGEMKGLLPDCDKCKCKPCCLDVGSKNADMPTGALMDVVRECIKK